MRRAVRLGQDDRLRCAALRVCLLAELSLRSGQFGKVKLATHVLTKAKVAVKIINKTKLEPDTLGTC